MPAKPGESVGEMLAARSSEKERANLNRGTTGEQRAAFTQFLKERARKKKKRPWK
jgi:hypothetical protein